MMRRLNVVTRLIRTQKMLAAVGLVLGDALQIGLVLA